ncbi:MAG: SGNH/GDSL hydrolase family protein [Phycisphaerales bacterium]|nr:SGNH/GDSL hydrolase family protein [Phycisphaerales bacterium]
MSWKPTSLSAILLITSVSVFGCGEDFVFRLPDPAVRYVAFGDSATKGPSSRDYIESLVDLLGESAETYSNEGEGGETTEDGVERLRSLVASNLFPNAEAMFFWEGGNDLTDFLQETDPLLIFSPAAPVYPFSDSLDAKLDEIQANVEAAIRTGHDAGWNVYVATYFFLPAGSTDCNPLLLDILLPTQALVANAYVTLLNERIRLAAAREGAILVDVASKDGELRGDSDNYFDCNHLSASGNAIVAALFLEVIQNQP